LTLKELAVIKQMSGTLEPVPGSSAGLFAEVFELKREGDSWYRPGPVLSKLG
jgi:hypothetical protein